MTSQQWRTDSDFAQNSVSKSIWWHIIIMIVPDQIRFKNNATLYITGGDVGMIYQNESIDVEVAKILSCATGSVTGVLFQIPNQNITFAGDPFQESRTENAVLAYTWQEFLDNPTDPNVIVRFPMVKAAVRAMDTITSFINSIRTDCQIANFLVMGESKRGWITWLTGAVDQSRVKAIVPIVLDLLNFLPAVHHLYRSYGAWSFAMSDFIENLHLPLTQRWDEPNFCLLQEYVDPYSYFSRLTMPKLVISGGMDQFMMADDSKFWWSDLPEPKHLMIVPNGEHDLSLGLLEVVPGIAAFSMAAFLNQPMPSFDWTINEQAGQIVATIENGIKIHEVNVWYAYSCGVNAWDNNKTRKDFRFNHLDSPCLCGFNFSDYCFNVNAMWSKRQIQPDIVNGKRTYTVTYEDFDPPSTDPKRWLMFMVDFKLDNPYGLFINMSNAIKRVDNRLKMAHLIDHSEKMGNSVDIPEDLGGYFDFNTQAIIWPNEYPYEDCYMDSCGSKMV